MPQEIARQPSNNPPPVPLNNASPTESPGPTRDAAFQPVHPIPRRVPEDTALDNLSSMSFSDAPTHSSNPLYTVSDRLRSRNDAATGRVQSDHDAPAGHNNTSRRSSSLDISSMSAKLPEDDGMRELREKVQQIRLMAVSTEEKARRMHDLMTADYNAFVLRARGLADDKAPTRHRSLSPAFVTSGQDPENPYNLQQGDTTPTYAPIETYDMSPVDARGARNDNDDDDDDFLPEPELGCKHYKRNVKVQCPTCDCWFTCRFCHDEQVTDHQLQRKDIRHMLCMICATPQRAAEYCKKCESLTACYYCDTCKLWDNDATHHIYHCDDCGICRRGHGLGKDYVHCKKCKVCVSISWAANHRCVEGATERDCPICGDYMFASSSTVVAMKCGHYIHRQCYDAYMQTSYKCPICNHSAVNMELQWRKLDRAIEHQPMPEQYRNTKALIVCNDCAARTCVPYHWLGNKCSGCDSYNTQETKLIGCPDDQGDEADAAEETRMADEANRILTRPPNAPSPVPVVPADIEGAELLARNQHGLRLGDAAFPASRPVTSHRVPPSPFYDSDVTAGSRSTIFTASAGYHSQSSSIETPIAEVQSNPETPCGYTAGSESDDLAFWGGRIAPSNWLPSPRSWNAPSFLAARASAEESQQQQPPTVAAAATDGNSSVLPGGGWTSPRTFLAMHLARRRNSEPSDETRRPRSWGPSGWTLPAAPWANPRFFGSGNQPAPVAAATMPEAESAMAYEGFVAGLGRGWKMPSMPAGDWASPRFLAQRFSRGSQVEHVATGNGGEEDEEDDSDSDHEGSQFEGSEADLEEDIQLFGHR